MSDSIQSWLRTRLMPLMSVALLGSVALVLVGYLVEKFSGPVAAPRIKVTHPSAHRTPHTHAAHAHSVESDARRRSALHLTAFAGHDSRAADATARVQGQLGRAVIGVVIIIIVAVVVVVGSSSRSCVVVEWR
jgi:hypothetical protein